MDLPPELLTLIFTALPYDANPVKKDKYHRRLRGKRCFVLKDMSAFSMVCKSWRDAVMPVWIGRPGFELTITTRYEVEVILRDGPNILANLKMCKLYVKKGRPSIDKRSALALLSACPLLESLSIRYDRDSEWVDDLAPTTFTFPSLRRLAIHWVTGGGYMQVLATLLSCCTDLETLKLSARSKVLNITAHAPVVPQSLRKLELSGFSRSRRDTKKAGLGSDNTPNVWRFSPALLQNVSEIVVDEPSCILANAREATSMVNLTKLRVKRITGKADAFVDQPDVVESLAIFRPLPALRHLSYQVDNRTDDDEPSKGVLQVCDLLNPPPHVETIRGYGIFEDLVDEPIPFQKHKLGPGNSALRSIHLECINRDAFCPTLKYFNDACQPLVDAFARLGVTLTLSLDDTELMDDDW